MMADDPTPTPPPTEDGPVRSTPAGAHRPVMLAEVLRFLAPRPGGVYVDATLGLGGHAAAILEACGPDGVLIGLDKDADQLERVRPPLGERFGADRVRLHHANFAGLPAVLAAEGRGAVDGVLADLGISSPQLDDAQRGLSVIRDGPLDMRLDRTRGATAAELLSRLSEADLAEALHELADEPHADRIAGAIVAARRRAPLTRTVQLAQVIAKAVGQGSRYANARHGKGHPAIRTFQALRLLVNRELENLEALMRALPAALAPNGRAVLISFHSGEDRRVKAGLKAGQAAGLYEQIGDPPWTPAEAEVLANPRSRSAKLRWAVRAAPSA